MTQVPEGDPIKTEQMAQAFATGDFDLIFGAAKQHMKIVDLPIGYQARSYGDTNINRWEGGWLLLKMLIVALKKIKFV